MLIQDIYIGRNCSDTYISLNVHYNIFYIQKKIYQAAKEGHSSLVHSLQKLLTVLYSTKVAAINITTKKVLAQKLYISKSTSNVLVKKTNMLLETNKLLILWCLEPEWLPKNKKCNMASRVKHFGPLSKPLQLTSRIEQQISLKYLDKKYLCDKLQSITWITQNINKCLQEQAFIQPINSPSWRNQTGCSIHDMLYNLIVTILFTDLEWLYFRQSISIVKKCIEVKSYVKLFEQNICICSSNDLLMSVRKIRNNFYLHAGLTKIQLRNQRLRVLENIDFYGLIADFKVQMLLNDKKGQHIQDISRKLFTNIRDILFHKDKFGRTRANSQVSSGKVSMILRNFSSQVKYNSDSIDDNLAINQLNKSVSNMIYVWSKKKHKNHRVNNLRYFCIAKLDLLVAKNKQVGAV